MEIKKQFPSKPDSERRDELVKMALDEGHKIIYPSPEELAPSTETDRAWAAGLFEGEGSVHPKKVRDRWYGILQVASTDLDVLHRWQSIFGGTIRLNRYIGVNKPCFILYVERGDRVEAIIKAIEPYLGERRKAAIRDMREKIASNPAKKLHNGGWPTRRAKYGSSGFKNGHGPWYKAS